jgi:hypothetical protein
MSAMNGTSPKIEILLPFRAAFEWMKAMLFRPFDLMKWLTIAFAAFLAGSWGGGGGNFSRLGRFGQFGEGDWKYHVTKHGDWQPDWDITPWIIAVGIGVGVLVLVLASVWMWVSARGRFIFTDCVVKNRGAIGEPWREYRREGNSYFLFSLAVAGCAIGFIAIFGFLGWTLFGGMEGGPESGAASAVFVVALIGFVLIWVVLALFFAVVSHFMVPVM